MKTSFLKYNWILHHDNACAHLSLIYQQSVEELGITIMFILYLLDIWLTQCL